MTSSLGLAIEFVMLLEAILTLLSVGAVVSVVTLPLPLVTGVPAFATISLKAML